jgi:glycosyltransferase involved in cell wall biosynthesis
MMSKPWRILQLASTSDMGGTERMILFLVEHIDHERFDPYVCSLIGSGELTRRAAPFCSETRNFEFGLPFSPRGILRLVQFIRSRRIDLVQTYGLRADTVGRIAARLGGAGAVVSSIRSIDPWRRGHHVFLDRLTAPLVHLFIANSEAGKQATVGREGFRPERIEVVYGGIPAREIPRGRREEVRRGLGVQPDAFPVVGVLANLREMKGHRDIVAALPGILEQLPHAVFLFAGRDDSGGAIARLAREAGVDHAIRFPGYVADTPSLLGAMDIFMLPSHWEGLPASVLEAMHAALPIITTCVGGIPELVRDGQEGILIDPANPGAIVEAVIRLSKDSALRVRLAEAARHRAQSLFSIESMVGRTCALYESVLAARAGTPRSG